MTYLFVQVALIALFLKLDLDFLCVARTPPCHSWRNPVERIMSTLNLGLQCIGLMREKMDDDFQTEAKCNNLKALRAVASRKPDFSSTVHDSVSHTKVLLTQIIQCLKLKGENFVVSTAASTERIDEMWSILKLVDPTLISSDTLRKSSLDSKPQLKEFMDHCCQIHVSNQKVWELDMQHM